MDVKNLVLNSIRSGYHKAAESVMQEFRIRIERMEREQISQQRRAAVRPGEDEDVLKIRKLIDNKINELADCLGCGDSAVELLNKSGEFKLSEVGFSKEELASDDAIQLKLQDAVSAMA